jgi:hypothetical protein
MNVGRWIIAPVVLGLIWLMIVMFGGDYFANNLAFESVDVEDYIFIFKILFAISVATTLVFVYIWYVYGGSKSVTLNLKGAATTWWILFLLSFIDSVGSISFYIFKFESESLGVNHQIILFVLLSMATYIPFYILTLLLSPLNVKYTVPGRKLIG